MLTKIDVKALRTATGISLHRDRAGNNRIVCTRTITGDPWRTEARHEIAVSGNRLPDGTECFEYWMSVQFYATVRPIINAMRAGDSITLHWSADHFGNQYTAWAGRAESLTSPHANRPNDGLIDLPDAFNGLFADALIIKIDRPGPSNRPDRRFEYLAGVCITPNNTARMIKIPALALAKADALADARDDA